MATFRVSSNRPYVSSSHSTGCLQNLLEKPEDPQIVQENAVAMVHGKVLKTISLLQARKFDDQDILEDMTYLDEKLQASVQDLRFVAPPLHLDYFVGAQSLVRF